MNQWTRYKEDHSMGFFTEDDIPFQFAMALGGPAQGEQE